MHMRNKGRGLGLSRFRAEHGAGCDKIGEIGGAQQKCTKCNTPQTIIDIHSMIELENDATKRTRTI
jgi:hypothetical protein